MNITIAKIIFRKLAIPFNKAFKHSSATRSETETVWIELSVEGEIVRLYAGIVELYLDLMKMKVLTPFRISTLQNPKSTCIKKDKRAETHMM